MSSPVVHNFAKALVRLASEKGKLNWIREIAEALIEPLSLAEIKQFLGSPRVDRTVKREFLIKLIPRESPQELTNFLNLVVDRNHGIMLSAILEKVVDYGIEAEGYEIITLISAEPLNEAEQLEIKEKLESLWGTRLFVRYREKPDLLGGLIVLRGDKLYDGSLTGQLQSLRTKMLVATDQN